MNRLLGLTAILEAATGLALIAAPTLVSRLLLGSEVAGAGLPLARVAGVGLLSLGIACWARRDSDGRTPSAFLAMLTYNSLVTAYLLYLGIGREWVGWLLWPAVALHAAMTAWCVTQLFGRPTETSETTK